MKTVCLTLLLCASTQAASWAQPERLRALHKGAANRIVGGQWADYGQLPYQAGIYSNDRAIFCGGTLVTPDKVLTGGQCTYGLVELEVHLGTVLIYDESEPGRVIMTASEVLVHPDFDVDSKQNDIALVLLPAPASGENIAPLRVPPFSMVGDPLVGVTGTASGWGGRGIAGFRLYQVLEYVNLKVIEMESCELEFTAERMQNQICVSTANGTAATCHGDMGGPLVYNGVVIGIMSTIEPTFCNQGRPVGFTKVTDYLDWLANEGGIPVDP